VGEEDCLVLWLVNLKGSREVELNHALKLAEKGLLGEVLRFVVVRIAANKTFIL